MGTRPVGAGLAQGSGAIDTIGPTGSDATGMDATGAREGWATGDMPGTADAIGEMLALGALGQATGDIPGTPEGFALGGPDASWAITIAGPATRLVTSTAVPIQDRRVIAHLACGRGAPRYQVA
jgi:hypothetical protein